MPSDGDRALRFAGDSVEGTDGKVERVVADTGGASVLDLGSDGSAVVGVGDLDPLSTVRGLGAGVLPPSVGVNGNEHVRVGVVVSASTGVAVLVEEGGESTGHLTRATAAGARVLVVVVVTVVLVVVGVVLGRGSGGRRGRRSGLDGRGGSSEGGVRVVVRGGGGLSGNDLGGRGRGSGVGDALRGSVLLEGLSGEHGVAALVEELGVVLLVAVESEVSSVVGVVLLEVTVSPSGGRGSGVTGDGGTVDEGHGGESREKNGRGEHCCF